MKEFKVNDRVIISNPKLKQFLKGRHGTIAEIEKTIKVQVDDIGEWYLNADEIEHEGKIKPSEQFKKEKPTVDLNYSVSTTKGGKIANITKPKSTEGIAMVWETEKAQPEPKKEKRAYNRKPKDQPVKEKRKYNKKPKV